MGLNEKDPLLKEPEKRDINRTCSFVLVLTTVALYLLGLGTYFFVSNEWIQQFEQSRIFEEGNFSDSSQCGNINQSDPEHALYEQVESETAKWQMFANIGWFIPSVFATSIVPAYSDCYGRRFVLIIGCTGTFMKVIVATFTIYFNLEPLYLVIASIVEGFTGSYFTVMSASFSIMADLTEMGRQRTLAVTLFDGVTMICVCLSGLVSGYFVKYTGYVISIASCCGMIACAYLMIILIVPETYPKHRRASARSVFSVWKGTFDFYISDIFKEKRRAYLLLITAYVLENLTSGPRVSLEILYQLGRPFCWSPEKIGFFSALRHLAQGLVGIFVVRPLQYCFSDLNIAIISMIFGTGSFVLEGLARTNLMLYMVPVLASLSYLCESMIKGMMSTITPPEKQGSLFAGVMMTQVTCLVVANFLFNTIYANTVSFMGGFIFLLQAGICLVTITVLIIFYTTRGHVLKQEKETCINTMED